MYGIPELQPIIALVIVSGCAVVFLFIASADATTISTHSAEASGKETMRGNSFPRLETVYFDYDSTTLSPAARENIARNAAVLKLNPELKVILVGHTDERGSDEFCLGIGEHLARGVHHYLLTLGIGPKRVAYISRGKEEPADPGNDEAAWAKNRRVEFKPVK